ncbi:MAG: response regulator transcription factor [Armatimonadota bacterium]|nr:response regulator transcription factor [Armatimonadota bacterium]MDR7485485.1 response regulator transcription factor [Armatimonadota bacterium]MDR7533030.1 response regulator transcription factor [Armatimonadota bacterium]MDR7536798.1 response regulator transcription factor [Armatimonadota bacterium]
MTDRIRVLLADDHPVLRAGLRALLEHEPDMAVVGEASTGREAVAMAAQVRPDVVVMDIGMPEMDGLEATRQIRDLGVNTHVLILTVHAQERYLFPVLKAGAAGYVNKTAADVELIAAIRTVAAGGAYLHPTATRALLEDFVARVQVGEEQDGYDRLSEREREVLKLVAAGYTAREIAKRLYLSPKSVETYRARILEKLELRTRAELVRYALRRGLLGADV